MSYKFSSSPFFPHMQNNYFPAAFKVTKICYFLGHHKWPGHSLLAFPCPVLYYVSSWFLDPFSVLLNRIKPTRCALEQWFSNVFKSDPSFLLFKLTRPIYINKLCVSIYIYIHIYTMLPKVLGYLLLMKGLTTLVISWVQILMFKLIMIF